MNNKNCLKKITAAIFCAFIILLITKFLFIKFGDVSGQVWSLETKISDVKSEVSDIQSELSRLRWRVNP